MRTLRGWTTLEVLLVVVVLAILVSASLRIDDGFITRQAKGLMRRLIAERHRAIVSMLPTCIVAEDLGSSRAILTWPPRGLLFTPDGLPRTCDGGGVGNTTILLEHRGRQAAVIVSALGRVRWELR